MICVSLFVSSRLSEGAEELYAASSLGLLTSQTVALLDTASPTFALAQGGGDIVVVDGTALKAESGPMGTMVNVKEFKSNTISVYTVQEEDTLSSIAEMFEVTPNTIRWANDIKGSTVKPGETLVILPVNGVQHTLKKGETLESVAREYGGDMNEILFFNHLSSSKNVSVGDTILIPNGEIETIVQEVEVVLEAKVAAPSSSMTHPAPGSIRTQGHHGYNAVDFGAPSGSNVVAALAGEVMVSRSGGWNGGYGNYIVLKHGDGTQTLYAHLSSNLVGVGQYVSQGELIGHVGSTGRSTGAHLHFEVRGGTNPF